LLCGTRAEECLREYGEQHREPLAHLAALINDVKSAPRGTLAALLVVMRELGRVVGTRA
jgi:hypothetical protein